jgi:hypothetical protein
MKVILERLAALSQLEKEGAIQRFEVVFELAWRILADYLEENSIVVNPVFILSIA